MKKRKLIFILVLIFAMCAGTAAYAAGPFADVAGTPYEASVTQLYNDGIINGYEDGTFAPYGHITRAEACKIIAAASGIKDPAGYQHQFRDMDGYSWANGYVGYAVEAGIVKGYPDGTFRPGAQISEDEMLTMLVRTLGFTDNILDGRWPDNYIVKGSELGLTKETGFSSAAFASRGMAALLAYNAFYEYESPVAANQYGIVIDKTEATTMKPAVIKFMDQNGAVRTFNIPVAAAAANKMASGDIIGLSVDAAGNITGMVEMENIYAVDKAFETTDTYAGLEINRNVVVFSYGEETDYQSGKIDFSSESRDYGVRSIRLMRNVTTSASYVVENNQVVAMVVPTDTGYSGRMYGLIEELAIAVDFSGSRVEAIDFRIGKDTFTILTNGNLDALPAEELYEGSGNLFELTVRNGVVRNIADSGSFGSINGKHFVELTSEKHSQMISEVDNMFVTVETGSGTETFGVMDDVVVYVIEKNGDYSSGTDTGIKEGVRIRAFDVTDDSTDYADIVVIDKRLVD